jgi:hypothetical protein
MGQSIACRHAQPLSSPRVDQRLTKIVAETERYRITGMLRLPPEGYRSRLSDYLNAPERAFLSLTEVELTPLDGDGPAQRLPFVALSVSHVVLVTHAGDAGE